MKILIKLWKYRIFKILFSMILFFLILDGIFYGLIIYTGNETLVIVTVMLTTFTTFTSSLIALYIPFLMKDIDKREKKGKERILIKLILQKIKMYLEIIIQKKKDRKDSGLISTTNDYVIPLTFPFFKSLNRSNSMILSKIGVNYVLNYSKSGQETSYLLFFNLYHLTGGTNPLCYRLSTKDEGNASKEYFNPIIKKILDNVNENFNIELIESKFLL